VRAPPNPKSCNDASVQAELQAHYNSLDFPLSKDASKHPNSRSNSVRDLGEHVLVLARADIYVEESQHALAPHLVPIDMVKIRMECADDELTRDLTSNNSDVLDDFGRKKIHDGQVEQSQTMSLDGGSLGMRQCMLGILSPLTPWNDCFGRSVGKPLVTGSLCLGSVFGHYQVANRALIRQGQGPTATI